MSNINFGPYLFDAYIRDGLTGEPRPLPKHAPASVPVKFLYDTLESTYSATPYCDWPNPVRLRRAQPTHRHGTLPESLEGRVMKSSEGFAEVWFEKRGVFRISKSELATD